MSEIEKRVRTQAGKSFQALNPGFFNPAKESTLSYLDALLPTKQPINDPGAIAPHFLRPSADEEKLNKTEKAYLGVLRSLGHHWIGIQCISLKLGDDCRYNPDFLILTVNGVLEAHEVKGFMREDALVKLKVASRMYRWLRIILVQRVHGQWSSSLVKP